MSRLPWDSSQTQGEGRCKGGLGAEGLDTIFNATAVLASTKYLLGIQHLCSSPVTLGCSRSHPAVLLAVP